MPTLAWQIEQRLRLTSELIVESCGCKIGEVGGEIGGEIGGEVDGEVDGALNAKLDGALLPRLRSPCATMSAARRCALHLA